MNKIPYYDDEGNLKYRLPKTKSRKILYEQLSEDDTYYDEHFMEEFIPRSSRALSIKEVLPYFIELSLQFCLVCLILAIFLSIINEEVAQSTARLITYSSSAMFLMAFSSSSLLNVFNVENNLTFLWEFLVVSLTMYCLSPIYMAAMANSADDSLFVLTLVSFSCHILLYDYKSLLNNPEGEMKFKDEMGRELSTEGTLSSIPLSIAIILLSSRFSTHVQSFCFQVISYAIFFKFQQIRKMVFVRSKRLYYTLYCAVMLITLKATFEANVYLISLFGIGQLMFLVLIPMFFQNLYREHKLVIGGPWELADLERFTINKLKVYKFEPF